MKHTSINSLFQVSYARSPVETVHPGRRSQRNRPCSILLERRYGIQLGYCNRDYGTCSATNGRIRFWMNQSIFPPSSSTLHPSRSFPTPVCSRLGNVAQAHAMENVTRALISNRRPQVHSLFSLLGLNRAYVTEQGRLVGVVALKEVRSICDWKLLTILIFSL